MTKRAEARRRDLTRLLCVVSAAPTWMFFVCVCVLEEEGKRWNKEYRSRLSLWYISLRFFYDKDRSDEGGKNGSAGIESSIIPPMFWNDDDNGQQRKKKKETNIFCFAVNERLSQVWMASDSFCESLWISKREKHIFPIYKLRREISPSSSSTLPKISLWKSPEEFIYIYIKGGLVCWVLLFFFWASSRFLSSSLSVSLTFPLSPGDKKSPSHLAPWSTKDSSSSFHPCN